MLDNGIAARAPHGMPDASPSRRSSVRQPPSRGPAAMNPMTKQARPLRRAALLALAGALLVSGGCAKQVTRISPDQHVDLSGRWNDVDSRLVAEA
jgi:hypothetical protein